MFKKKYEQLLKKRNEKQLLKWINKGAKGAEKAGVEIVRVRIE